MTNQTEMTMKPKRGTTVIAHLKLVLAAGSVAMALSLSTLMAEESPARNGQLHVTKDCPTYTGSAGDHCTIASSNLAAIPTGSVIYYDQAAGIPAGLLDSNIVLDAGDGDRAVGRCTLDFGTALGLCTFSDGTGKLAGFTARVNVSYSGGTLFSWDGAYSFEPLPRR